MLFLISLRYRGWLLGGFFGVFGGVGGGGVLLRSGMKQLGILSFLSFLSSFISFSLPLQYSYHKLFFSFLYSSPFARPYYFLLTLLTSHHITAS